MLVWTQNGHDLETFGGRGHYLIKRQPGFTGCILQATGHDALPMLALPAYGKPFTTTHSAKEYAQKLDRVRALEPQLGGE